MILEWTLEYQNKIARKDILRRLEKFEYILWLGIHMERCREKEGRNA